MVMPHYTETDLLQDWPVPETFAANQSRALTEIIDAEINHSNGRISFNRFMELALHAPGLGYYSGGARKFGVEGDFTTAPEISPLFSACLARQCEQLFNEIGVASVLELGAGTGVMAADILSELQRRNSLPENYLILETSADLRQRQKQLLQQRHPDYFSRIHWLDGIPSEPIECVVIANEMLDAMPVHRVKWKKGIIHELMVTSENNSFAWLPEPASDQLLQDINAIIGGYIDDMPDGYTTEFNLMIPSFVHSLADLLKKGTILFIDYGYPRHEYYHPQRIDGTLHCHYRQRRHDNPFIYIGLQDITASVDFTLVAESARSAGLDVSGYTTQSAFLMACNIDELIQQFSAGNDMASLRFAQQAGQLLLPGQMGESFKVIALSRNIENSLLGFEFANQLHRL